MYKGRNVRSPADGYKLFKQFLGDLARECVVLIGINTENKSKVLAVASIASLNAAIVHPREIYKSLFL